MRYLTLILIIAAFSAGCTKHISEQSLIERPVVMHDTLTEHTLHIDSIYLRDSIYLQGETLVKDRYHYIYKVRTDTVYRTRTDTLTLVRTRIEQASPTSSVNNISLRLIVLLAILFASTTIIKFYTK